MAWWPARLEAWTRRDCRAHKSMCGRKTRRRASICTYPLKGPGAWFTPWLPPCCVPRLWPCFRRCVRVCVWREGESQGEWSAYAPFPVGSRRGWRRHGPKKRLPFARGAECRRRSVCLARAWVSTRRKVRWELGGESQVEEGRVEETTRPRKGSCVHKRLRRGNCLRNHLGVGLLNGTQSSRVNSSCLPRCSHGLARLEAIFLLSSFVFLDLKKSNGCFEFQTRVPPRVCLCSKHLHV